MDEPLDMNRLGKGRKGPWDKQLDCEGIDISAEKGKVNIVDIPGFEGTMDELDNLVNKWDKKNENNSKGMS